MKIFIDDERFPKEAYLGGLLIRDQDLYKSNDDWTIVRTYNEFVEFVEGNGLPDYVSFDHDLADMGSHKEKTGYDCVKWLVDYCIDNKIIKFPNYQVHSANPIGKKNITSYIENGKRVGLFD